MSSAQRQTRRTSSRLADELDGSPPAKKQKLEKTASRGKTTQSNARSVANNRSNNRVYDQIEEDFNFRKKKKAPVVEKRSPVPESNTPSVERNTQNKAADRKQPSKPPNGANPAILAPEPVRRSKRLSGEAEHARPQEIRHSSETDDRGRERERPPDSRVKRRAKVPQQSEGELRVDKERRETKIALPFQDTPVIQRNKDMRQTSAENRRRSSSNFRGRRASGLIDSGTSNALPHGNVDASDFYKFISQELPEPRRMTQLLTWCGSRALTERPSSPSKENVSAILAARTIQDEVLKDFADRSEMSDWFTRKDEAQPVVLVKKPNPRNVQNASKLVELERELQRLEKENSQWDVLLSELASSLHQEPALSNTSPINASNLLDAEQADLLRLIKPEAANESHIAQEKLKNITAALEFKIDSFAEGVHAVSQFEKYAREMTDQVTLQAHTSLQSKADQNSAHFSAKESTGDMLRALSRLAR